MPWGGLLLFYVVTYLRSSISQERLDALALIVENEAVKTT